jgi:P4 family phage/plasmid primase-like protien
MSVFPNHNGTKNFNEILNSNYYNKAQPGIGQPTHTRIKNEEHKINGGIYSIHDQTIADFHKAYITKVFKNKQPEYMTEKQLENEGPLVVDIDERYPATIKERQHDLDFITEIIEWYCEALVDEIFQFHEGHQFDVYVMEKPNVNCCEKETKDGIHLLFDLNVSQQIQLFAHNLVVKRVQEDIENDTDGTHIINKLGLTNSVENIFDETIARRSTNWQLYGSRKPGHDSYKITNHIRVQFKNGSEYDFLDLGADFDVFNDFEKLSVRNNKRPTFSLQPKAIKNMENAPQKKKRKVLQQKTGGVATESAIQNEDDLNTAIERFLNSIHPSEYKLKMAYDYVMLLPKSYYDGPGAYDKYIQVGCALHNTSRELFIVWLKFASQSTHFKYEDIDAFHREKWDGFRYYSGTPITFKSLQYWVRKDGDQSEYEKIKLKNVEYFVNISVQGKIYATDFDLARVVHTMYEDKFVCCPFQNKFMWYRNDDGYLWKEASGGTDLRMLISTEICALYQSKMTGLINDFDDNGMDKIGEIDPQKDEENNKRKILSSRLCDVISKLKTTSVKNNIMVECRELFKDDDFYNKLDENRMLLSCSNGVIDFETKTFRPRKPDDYLSKTTKTAYKPLNKCDPTIIEEINTFMTQLFPIEELRNYMWEHLASVLIGTNENQTFNVYSGGGRNGKSALIELMSCILGDYKAQVPLSLITRERSAIGGVSPEIANLKGVRYAVSQEPKKKTTVNEGIIKELTGGDEISGRALYKDVVSFVPQFTFVCALNELFDMNGCTDYGTWRRFRICEFMSLFTENPIFNDPTKPYQYEVDKKLNKKFNKWKSVFLAMLVDIVYKTDGIVKDCEIVMKKSNEYQKSENYILEFIEEKLEIYEDETPFDELSEKDKKQWLLKKNAVSEEFSQWFRLNYNKKAPAVKELYEDLDKRFQKHFATKKSKTYTWKGVRILYEFEPEPEPEN